MKPLLYLILSFFYLASITTFQAQVIPSKKNNLWGGVSKTNKTIIPHQFKSVDFYNDAYLLTTTENNKKGLYTVDGKLVLKAKYDAVIPLNTTYFQVYLNGKTGVVTNRNQSVLPIEFSSITFDTIQHHFIVSKNANYGVLDMQANTIVPLEYNNIALYNDTSYLFKKGKSVAVTNQLKNLTSLHYVDDLIGLENSVLVKKKNRWGLESLNGKTLLSAIYERIKPFGKKYLLVKKDKAYGVFNQQGEQISSFDYNEPFYMLKDSTFWTMKNNDWVSVSLKNGNEQALPYEKVLSNENHFFRVVKNNQLIVVDKNNHEYFTTNAYQDIEPVNDTLFNVLKNRKWGLVTIANDTIIPIAFDRIMMVGKFSTDSIHSKSLNLPLFIVENQQKKGVYTLNGLQLIPIQYDNISINPLDSVIITEINLKKGAIGRSGNEILAPKYQNIQWHQKQGAFVLTQDDKTILKSNIQKMTLAGTDISFSKWASAKNCFFATKNDKKGLLTLDNKLLIPFKYQRLYELDTTYIIGITDAGAKIFDTSGKEISSNFYDSVSIYYQQSKPLFLVKKENQMAGIDKQGNIIIPFDNYQLSVHKDALIRATTKEQVLGYFTFSGIKYF